MVYRLCSSCSICWLSANDGGLALAVRVGYRKISTLVISALSAVVIVVLFKTLLKVNLPSGLMYESLPDGLRQIMLTYF